MANITTELIKELRDKTGLSIMHCKKALEEAEGDMDKAVGLLQQRGVGIGAKKADRALGAGFVASYVHSTGTMGTILELLCETDFVSNNEEYKALAYNIAMHITAVNPESTEVLMTQPYIKNPEMTITQLIEGCMQKFGERIELGRYTRLSVGK